MSPAMHPERAAMSAAWLRPVSTTGAFLLVLFFTLSMGELNLSKLKLAFDVQKFRALKRGISWQMTFEQWLEIWRASGHLGERGRGVGKFVMARYGDQGPYSVGNVQIQLCEANARDARVNNKATNGLGALKRTGTGRGWTLRAGRYQVYCGPRYVGTFSSQHEAEAAYAKASVRHLEMALGGT